MESYSRKHFGCVRQENACLNMQDDDLISNLDAMQYDLASSKSQVRPRGPRIGVKNSAAVMSEQIRQLQANLESQATELKAAELRADCSQEAAAHADVLVATLTEELSSLREELEDNTALGKRAELQRNQALQNAETLKEAFKDYKATISIKLKRVMESESKLKESLVECDREKEEWEKKCTELEKGNVEQNQTISQLKEEGRQVTSAAAGLQAQLEDAGHKVLHLERQLMERGAELRELASLRQELQTLQTLAQSQEQRAAQSHREAQQSQAELASLDAILTLLHLREGAVGTLCVRPCMFPPVNYVGTAHLTLKPGEGFQQLLRALQAMEAERSAQTGLRERLQERLSRAQEEISSLQSSMTQRASHYQSLHTELLDRVSQAAGAEKELKRKSARVASMEKQLQEKTSACSQAALTNTELERQLLEKTSTLQHYQSLMTKKQREYQQALDKCKQSQSQQLTEQQHRTELLQQSQVSLMEQERSSLQTERDEAQDAVLLLQDSVDRLTQQRQVEGRHNEELLQSLKEQAAQSASTVCELQSSLSACREELNLYLQQMDKMKKTYESELQKNRDRVSSLQEKLHGAGLACHSSSEENLQLQLSLQRQQTMLTESTAHISELEESQSQLQKQVSSLEQQLERARAALQAEARNRERDTQQRDDLQEMKQHNAQLSESVGHLTSEMSKCRGELASKDSELQRLRKDVKDKMFQLRCMDESLQHTKKQLDSRSDAVMDLEEKLHRCEADRLKCVHRAEMMEAQLQAVQRELAETLEQLRELRDVLKSTQSIAEERRASVEQLTVQLSETQRELEERTHEVLDMDSALKERQGELQQRAQLLDQLDVAIREHQQETEEKVESLQQSLQARERELSDTQRELSVRAMEEVRLGGVQEELALKEARWLQLEAELQGMVTSLELDLDLEKEQHSKELEALQQTRGQLLKVSEQMSSTMLSSQEQLAARLQQSHKQLEEAEMELEQTRTQLDRSREQVGHLQTCREQTQTRLLQSETQLQQSRTLQEQTSAQNTLLRAQLEQLATRLNEAQVQVGRLQAELQTSKKSMETWTESLLIKESEATRLQVQISGLQRAAEQHQYSHTLSSAALHMFSESSSSPHCPPASSPRCPPASSPHCPPASPQKLQTTLPSSKPASSPRASNQTCSWLQSSSVDSLDLPLSLKATLREAMGIRPWESSSSPPSSSPSPSIPSFLADHSWQGLSNTEASGISDRSFNPLTYMLDKRDGVHLHEDDSFLQQRDEEQPSESRRESVCTLVGEEEEEQEGEEEEEEVDMRSLTGMLRFVNQTLAQQEDPSLWSPAGPWQAGLVLQSDVQET